MLASMLTPWDTLLPHQEFAQPVLEGMDPEAGISEEFRTLRADKVRGCVGVGPSVAERVCLCLWVVGGGGVACQPVAFAPRESLLHPFCGWARVRFGRGLGAQASLELGLWVPHLTMHA